MILWFLKNCSLSTILVTHFSPWNRVSLCSAGCSRTLSVDQVEVEFMYLPACSWVMTLKECTKTSQLSVNNIYVPWIRLYKNQLVLWSFCLSFLWRKIQSLVFKFWIFYKRSITGQSFPKCHAFCHFPKGLSGGWWKRSQ